MSSNRALAHYPALAALDNEAPPWLPWKSFKSSCAKARVRSQGKSGSSPGKLRDIREVVSINPLRNALLSKPVVKLRRKELLPVLRVKEEISARRLEPAHPITFLKRNLKPVLHKRWKSTNLREWSEPTKARVASFHCERPKSGLGFGMKMRMQKNRTEQELQAQFDISQWSNDGNSPVNMTALD